MIRGTYVRVKERGDQVQREGGRSENGSPTVEFACGEKVKRYKEKRGREGILIKIINCVFFSFLNFSHLKSV